MAEIPLESAPEAVQTLIAGIGSEPIVFTRENRPVATLAPTPEAPIPGEKLRRELGLMKGWLTVLEEDDEHLEGFKEYMP